MVADTRAAYGPDVLGAGSTVVVLLDDERRLTGRTLIRALDPAWSHDERTRVLVEAVHVLRDGHPMGESGSQCLLITFEHGAPGDPGDAPLRGGVDAGRSAWRTALQQACASCDLRAVDVVAVRQGVSARARYVSESG